jgi:hypothetical protein
MQEIIFLFFFNLLNLYFADNGNKGQLHGVRGFMIFTETCDLNHTSADFHINPNGTQARYGENIIS